LRKASINHININIADVKRLLLGWYSGTAGFALSISGFYGNPSDGRLPSPATSEELRRMNGGD